jgi:hypothetical protein
MKLCPGTLARYTCDESVNQESLDSGAAVFMEKPASLKEIAATINSLLEAMNEKTA